ncbi:MAG: NADH:flavin oxidoreductase/NADH oxidase [Betaproteobacteria bacterium]|nr:NADH:flavin oxidoreductase/NADH oxidase [Betaproteobacteria bacterium]
MTAKLFTPIQLGGITLPNRIIVSPMCQYSAADGAMTDWHTVHLGSLAISRAGLTIIEATGVTREGRISHGCTGLYNDLNEAAMQRAVQVYRGISTSPIGVQLAHAGRKASSQVPWIGGKALPAAESPWQTVAPSALPYAEDWHTPHELTVQEIQDLCDAFAAAATRALRIGLDLVELHSAHGYLLHQFLSPNSNKRTDRYGGSLENRMRAPLEIARALRESWPKERALGARITASEWAPGGFEAQEAASYASELKAIGFDYVCVSSGGNVPQQKIKVEPGYQVHLAEAVKRGARLPVMAVGMIADPQQAEDILGAGRADMVALARGLLDDPRWVWHAAERFEVKLDLPPQYRRARYDLWPGAQLARPKQTA